MHRFTGRVASSSWRAVVHGGQLLKNGLIWRIGTGTNISFWFDAWLEDGTLADKALVSLDATAKALKVSDFCSGNCWNLADLRAVLPEDYVRKISAIPIGLNDGDSDCLIWKHSKDGNFSVKSAYLASFDDEVSTDWSWRDLWKLKLPPRVLHFLWLTLHGRLLCNEQRTKRGMTDNPLCDLCDGCVESIEHILRRCDRAKLVWSHLGMHSIILSSTGIDFNDWMRINLFSKRVIWHNLPWWGVFAFACWWLWKWRNASIFASDFIFPSQPQTLISKSAKEWFEVENVGAKMVKSRIFLAWDPPPPNFVKLNVDGSRKSGNGYSSAGGVIRATAGAWIAGFSVNIGVGSVLNAELWGFFHGLSLVWRMGYRKVLVELDSAVVISLVMDVNSSMHPLAHLITACRELLHQDWICSVSHVYREKNRVADGMATLGHDLDIGLHFFYEPPPFVDRLIVEDAAGIPHPRFVNS